MFNKEWLEARFKEISTKWGIGVLLVVGGLAVGSDKLGEWSQSLTSLAGLIAAAKLISTKEGEKGGTPE